MKKDQTESPHIQNLGQQKQELKVQNRNWSSLKLEQFQRIICFLTSKEMLELRLVSSYFLKNLGMTFNGKNQYDQPHMKKTNTQLMSLQQHNEAHRGKQLTYWMKLKQDHFKAIIAFLDIKQILELRLVDTSFLKNIKLCYPAIIHQVTCQCKVAQEQLQKQNYTQVKKEVDLGIQAAQKHLASISTQDICELRAFKVPPPVVEWITIIIRNILVGVSVQGITYTEAKQIYQNPVELIKQLKQFDYKCLNDFQISEILRISEQAEKNVGMQSLGALSFYKFVNELRKKIEQLKQYSKAQQQQKAIARSERYLKILNK